MAVLSFKKRGKDETAESAPASLGDMSLNGGSLSLGDLGGGLGGGLGTLSKLSDMGQPGDSLSGPMMTDAMPKSDKKLQEVEANVNDLKSQMDKNDLSTKAMRGDLDNIKGDLSQINESIRTLLNVYEAVSKQYNPFVDGEGHAPEAPMAMEPKSELSMSLSDVKVSEPAIKAEAPAASDALVKDGPEALAPFDDDGPLDRIVRPDEEELLPLKNEEPTTSDMTSMFHSDLNDEKPAPAKVRLPAVQRTASREDVYPMEQTRRLIDHLMGKMCTERAIGNEIDAADIRALELWIGEFKRMGGI
jgi:hypothetical protein